MTLKRLASSALVLVVFLAPYAPGARANTAWDGVHSEPGQDNSVVDITAVDGSNAWALAIRSGGQSSEMVGLFTTNGMVWSQMTLPASGNPMFPIFFSRILFVDAQTGYLAGLDFPSNKIWRTTNGGQTWAEVTTTDEPVTHLQALPTGEVFGVAGSEVVSSVDGVTWTSVAVDGPGGEVGPEGIFMLNETCGWLVGGWAYDQDTHPAPSDGAAWYTSDGGQTWAVVAEGLPYYLRRAAFVAGDLGFAAGTRGDRGVIVRTTDGGATWSEVALPVHPAMPDVCVGFGFCVDDPVSISQMEEVRFFDAQRGVALGLACLSPPCDPGDTSATYLTSFLRTYDGGQTWAHDEDYEDAMPDIDLGFISFPGALSRQVAMAFPDPNSGFLGGQHNTILRYEASDPEPPGSTAMPGCDSNANTNGQTNSNNASANDSGCGCASSPATGTPTAILVLLWILLRMLGGSHTAMETSSGRCKRALLALVLLPALGIGPGGCGDGAGSDTLDSGSNQNPDAVAQHDSGTNTNGNGNGICGANMGQLFDSSHPWNQPVDTAPLDSESAAIIAFLQANHNDSQRFRIDGPSDQPNSLYGITVLYADDTVTHRGLDSGLWSPDCDTAPIPMPPGGAIEANPAFACDDDGDCHLIVIDTAECRLFEMWRADDGTNNIEGCLAVWDLTAPYDPELRGDCCTSADAAGLPIAAHMFSADEIAAGEINHAIRFILPNALMRDRVYVRPATHSTPATSGPADAPPYGARLRLNGDFDMNRLNAAAQVVAQALQTYGMILSDGGNVTLTATNDRFTQHKWIDVGLGPNDLTDLEWTDFEVVELGQRHVFDGSCNCYRTVITQ